MRYLFLIGCWLLAETAAAQVKDTVRDDVDYKMPRAIKSSGASKTKKQVVESADADGKINHYWGLQANQLLQQLFNFSGNNRASGNPYVLTYSFNSIEKGSGLSFGLGYRVASVDDLDQGQKRSTKTSDINFRMGFEKKTSFGNRWILGRGVDFLLIRSVDITEVDNGGINSEFKTNGLGFGPRMSISYALTQQVLLGTELSWYYQQLNTKTDFPSVPNSSSDLKERSFELQMPTAVFLTLRF